MTALLPLIAIALGLVALVWGADRFVAGAAAAALHLRISPLIIGLIVMGFGTSAPELLVSAFAAGQGNPGLAVGNALGSNIANIALVMGVTALLAPIRIESAMLRREFPLLLVATGGAWLLLLDNHLGRIDGALLAVALVALLVWMVRAARGARRADDALQREIERDIPRDLPLRAAALRALIGLAALLAGSRLLVWGGVATAQWLGVSDLIIGLTIVAIGTSLPELAASIAAARKGEHDMAVGNVIGSNLFNLLGVLALPGLIAPAPLESAVMARDYPLVAALTVAFYLLARGLRGGARRRVISRPAGALLTAAFLVWLTVLYHTAA